MAGEREAADAAAAACVEHVRDAVVDRDAVRRGAAGGHAIHEREAAVRTRNADTSFEPALTASSQSCSSARRPGSPGLSPPAAGAAREGRLSAGRQRPVAAPESNDLHRVRRERWTRCRRQRRSSWANASAGDNRRETRRLRALTSRREVRSANRIWVSFRGGPGCVTARTSHGASVAVPGLACSARVQSAFTEGRPSDGSQSSPLRNLPRVTMNDVGQFAPCSWSMTSRPCATS